MTLDEMKERSGRRKKKGRKRRDGWEKLRERRVFGVDSLPNGGLVSPRNSVNLVNGGSIPPITYGASTSSGVSTKSLGQTIGSEQAGSSSGKQRDGDGDGYFASTPGGPDDTRVPAKNTNKKPPKGQVVKGNINLNNRPVVKNKDGSISTVRSISMTEGKLTVLIPTVIRNQDGTGKIVSDREAWKHYKRTGEHLGKFSNPKDADAYAMNLSKEQAAQYLPQGRTSPSRMSAKSAQAAYSPRDNDTDVFIDIESARRRAQQLGCIGISRRVSKSGKTVWMPCTNLTDYNNLTGMTALGRNNQEKRTQKVVRTILSNELKKRKKSLVEEIIGKAIGPKISGVSRFSARTITQRFDPRAEDGDGDGLLQDGSAFERPNVPGVPKPQDVEKPISTLSVSSVGKWFDATTPKQREKLTGTPIENFGASSRSARGFASISKPIKAEPIKIEGLENPDASETNPFRNLGGRKMGEIIRGLVKPSNKNKKQRTTYLVGGTTGGGKSTVLDEHLVVQGIVPSRNEAAHVDPDFIKLGLTGYNDGAGAPMVHDESLRSAQRTMDDARKEGMDLVATGAGSTRQRAIIAQARQNGDRVVAHWVHVPAEEASKRIKERQQRDGRKIPDQTGHFARSIPRMVSDAVSNGEVDEFYIWDNNVEQGKPPRLIASFKDGKLDILDQTKLDEFMNGNKLSPKPREGNTLSDGEREALKESDEFMGLASSSKPKKGGRYTPPQNKPQNKPSPIQPQPVTPGPVPPPGIPGAAVPPPGIPGALPPANPGAIGSSSPFGKTPGTGAKTSISEIEDIDKKIEARVVAFIAKLSDRLNKRQDGSPKNSLNYVIKKLAKVSSGMRYLPTEGIGRKEGPRRLLEIPNFSLKGQLDTPEGIRKVVNNFVPIKSKSETDDDFISRLFETIPALKYSIISDRENSEVYLKTLLKNAKYDPREQKNLRKVLENELTNNEAFRQLVEEFGLPMFINGNGMTDGSPMEGVSAYHTPFSALIVVSKDHVKSGSHEAIGSTFENKKFDTVNQTLRHEWFHYLDALLMGSDQKTFETRVDTYLQGLTDLVQDPESVVRKIFEGKDMPKYLEEKVLSAVQQLVKKNNPGLSDAKVRKTAIDEITEQLQENREEFIKNLEPLIDELLFGDDMISEILRDRGGILDKIAQKYSEYARYGVHELIAEVGRMITSTPAERAAPNNNIAEIDESTIDLLEDLFPSMSRSQWLNIIRVAYPGIEIKVLRNR